MPIIFSFLFYFLYYQLLFSRQIFQNKIATSLKITPEIEIFKVI